MLYVECTHSPLPLPAFTTLRGGGTVDRGADNEKSEKLFPSHFGTCAAGPEGRTELILLPRPRHRARCSSLLHVRCTWPCHGTKSRSNLLDKAVSERYSSVA